MHTATTEKIGEKYGPAPPLRSLSRAETKTNTRVKLRNTKGECHDPQADVGRGGRALRGDGGGVRGVRPGATPAATKARPGAAELRPGSADPCAGSTGLRPRLQPVGVV